MLQRLFQPRSFSRTLLLSLLFLLVLTGCSGFGTSTTPTDNSTSPTSTPASGGQTPISSGQTLTGSGQTPTSSGQTPTGSGQTPVATAGVTPTATSAPQSQPVAFQVTGVTASVTPNSYTGGCASTLTFTFKAVITIPSGTSGGTVQYRWQRSDNASSTPQPVTFHGSTKTRTVTTTWTLGSVYGNGTTFWEALQVTSPNSMTSNHATFSFHCIPPGNVVAISASVTPTSYTCGATTVTFHFSATITIEGNSSDTTITYIWTFSDGGTVKPVSVVIPAGSTSTTISTTWTVGQVNGTSWSQVDVSSPNAFSSNKASFTISC